MQARRRFGGRVCVSYVCVNNFVVDRLCVLPTRRARGVHRRVYTRTRVKPFRRSSPTHEGASVCCFAFVAGPPDARARATARSLHPVHARALQPGGPRLARASACMRTFKLLGDEYMESFCSAGRRESSTWALPVRAIEQSKAK